MLVRVGKKILILAVIFGFSAPTALAAATNFGETYNLPASTMAADNLYLAFSTAVVSGPVFGDLVVAAGDITISGKVTDDILFTGGTVEILGSAGGDIRGAGGKITVAEPINGDAMLFGGSISLLPTTSIKGDLTVGGGRTAILGEINGNVFIGGQDIFIDGKITGSIKVYSAGSLRIGENAVIGGDITYQADKEIEIADGAVVKGDVVYEYSAPIVSAEDFRGFLAGLVGIAFLLRLLILATTVLFFVLVFRRFSGALIHSSVNNFWKELLVGLVVFVAVPFACVLVALTVFGGLVAITVFVAWLLMSIIGQVYAGVVFAYTCAKHLFNKELPPLVSWKTAVVGVLALNIVGLVPYVGTLIWFGFFLNALGTVSHLAYERFLVTRK